MPVHAVESDLARKAGRIQAAVGFAQIGPTARRVFGAFAKKPQGIDLRVKT